MRVFLALVISVVITKLQNCCKPEHGYVIKFTVQNKHQAGFVLRTIKFKAMHWVMKGGKHKAVPTVLLVFFFARSGLYITFFQLDQYNEAPSSEKKKTRRHVFCIFLRNEEQQDGFTQCMADVLTLSNKCMAEVQQYKLIHGRSAKQI